ncbi:TolC family protein [Colwellia sp. 6_MG-2023]|uniref:TolC family protein n=1 Tax=Colwellia sp. 6_MG-2023 TaxID=3062676 RepID=UPI0026E15DD5|nr:TolC family protein [Colwellia sp. 6_MG-2023]MDO6487574.1 TolC family protein [Colwellia sp. 6_MG-2023]
MKIIILILTSLLLGCAHKNNIIDIDSAALPESFIKQGSSEFDIHWWNSFGNKELTQFINQALDKNLSLQANKLRLKSSEISSKIAGAAHYPDLNSTANASSDFDNFPDIDTASLGLTSSWELDIWGSISANENRFYWNYKGQESLYKARANLVAGNIASAWLGLVSEEEKKLVLAIQHRRTKDALNVISRRFAMGKNSVTNIWQQQRLLKSIEVQQSTNLTNIYLYKQTLALWLGISTNELTKSHINVSSVLPPLPQMGLPAKLLKSRPDIELAFARIKSANENLAIAIAGRYPRITLRANYSTSKSSVESLFDDWEGNLIAALTLPIFDSGTTKLVVEQRELELKALILDYQQVWLEAIASVNQVLANENQLSEVVKNLTLQLDLAERTEKLTTIQYLNGKTNYINLLRAQETILSLERQLIDANRRLVTNRVLLYRELSHGDFSLKTELNAHEHNTHKFYNENSKGQES